jgi:tetratricopeptide (TPR) repeat protein
MKEYKRAIDDCHSALKLNPLFARAFQRLFKCHLSLGDLQAAKEALDKAKELDSVDQTDSKTLENVLNQERVVARHVEKGDFETAVTYLDQVLQECALSESHAYLKLEYLLRASKLAEAVTYSQQAALLFKASPRIQGMRGRIIFYNGNDALGRKQLQAALELDPENEMIKKAIRNIKLSHDMKERATDSFKKGDIQAAIAQFQDCLELDELNVTYNAQIYFNIA